MRELCKALLALPLLIGLFAIGFTIALLALLLFLLTPEPRPPR